MRPSSATTKTPTPKAHNTTSSLSLGHEVLLRRRLRLAGEQAAGARGRILGVGLALLKLAAHLALDFHPHGAVLREVVHHVEAPLRHVLPLVAVPAAAARHDLGLLGRVEQAGHGVDALAEEDVQLHELEGRGHLVLHDLDLDGDARVLPRDLLPPHVEAEAAVVLERVAARGDLRRAVDDADLAAELVEEDDGAVGLGQRARDLPQRLGHEPRLRADLHVAHVAVELHARHERGHRVHDDDLHSAAADELVHDVQRHLARVRLRHEQVVRVHAEVRRVARVQRVLRVDEGRRAAQLLDLGHRVQRQRRLARALRAVDLNDAPLGVAPAEREVQRHGPGRRRAHRHVAAVPELQNAAAPVAALDGRHDAFERLLARLGR
mmetsp:Transcript_23849/g.75064  ORF Transcript_23849/g.75064 Transcript_23849/m.75064 type:complete len:379 (+) Transcript_23849:232-1368(+)